MGESLSERDILNYLRGKFNESFNVYQARA
jgi:hypothetical protein